VALEGPFPLLSADVEHKRWIEFAPNARLIDKLGSVKPDSLKIVQPRQRDTLDRDERGQLLCAGLSELPNELTVGALNIALGICRRPVCLQDIREQKA